MTIKIKAMLLSNKTKSVPIKISSGEAAPNMDEQKGAASASETESASGENSVTKETYREIQRENKKLQVRIRELEFQLAGGPRDGDEAAEVGEATEESAGIIALIKDLHSQIEAAQELKAALETDLGSVREKLAKEQGVRSELEAQVKLLEAKAALGEQLREDLAFVEEERNEIARRLEQTAAQLTKVTEDRDNLSEQTAADQRRIKVLESEKINLEAKVMNLEETVADMGRLRQELADTKKELGRSKDNAQNLKGKLDATEAAKKSLEYELSTTRDLVSRQSGEIAELKESLSAANAELADLRAKLDSEGIDNARLVETNRRADHEIKTLNERLEAVKKEIDLNKKALRDIRTAAMRTGTRARETSSGA